MLTRGQIASLLRKELDERADLLRSLPVLPPQGGWIGAIRQSLGISSAALARRLGIAQSSVTRLEQSEKERTISLASLERVADALGCSVVYALVPRRPLEVVLREQAETVLSRNREVVRHTMVLEGESVDTTVSVDVQELILKLPRTLWDESQ